MSGRRMYVQVMSPKTREWRKIRLKTGETVAKKKGLPFPIIRILRSGHRYLGEDLKC